MNSHSATTPDSTEHLKRLKEKRIHSWLRIVACIVPVGLLLAHFSNGADTFPIAVPFILLFCVLYAAAIIIDETRSVGIEIAAIACLFLAWFSLGLFGNWHRAQYEVQTLIAAGAVLGTGFIIGSRNGTLKIAWSALVWSLAAFAILSGFDYLSQTSAPSEYGRRLSAGFGSPNSAATLFAMSMLIGGAKLLVRFQDPRYESRPRGERVAYLAQHEFASLILVTIAAACLLFTVSRAGILAGVTAFFGLMGFELWRMTRRGQVQFLKRRRVYIGLGALAAIVFLLAVSGEINPNHAEALLQNVEGRTRTYSVYWSAWLERAWFGHGLGSFDAVNDASTTLQNADALSQMGAAHNVFLQWLLQQGIVGFAAMSFVFAVIFYPIIMALRGASSKPRNFMRLTIALTLLVFAHGMVDYALEIPSIMWTYAFILGLAAGYSTQTRLRRAPSAE